MQECFGEFHALAVVLGVVIGELSLYGCTQMPFIFVERALLIPNLFTAVLNSSIRVVGC